MKFKPAAEKTSWGGSRFIAELGKSYTEKVEDAAAEGGRKKYVEMPLTSSDKIGESWELADLGFRDSEVVNGWLAGSTISEVLETYLEDIVGENVYSGFGRQFPLMVKFLDVKGRTPVMVCPDDEIASQRYDTLGKFKMWHVLDAEPGSFLYMGLRDGISASELYDRCHDGTLENVLNVVTPHKGDSYLIPSGLIHGAGDGVLLAEISESSDLDFKIYDAGHADDLALEAAFDFIDFGKYDNVWTVPAGSRSGKAFDSNVKSTTDADAVSGPAADKLVSRKEFTVTRIALKDALHINTGTTDAFLLYVCISGSASLQIHNEAVVDKYDVKSGEVIMVPAEVTDFFAVPQSRDTVLLEVTIEPYEVQDAYIDPDVEATLPDGGDNDDVKKPSVEDFLKMKAGSGKEWPLN